MCSSPKLKKLLIHDHHVPQAFHRLKLELNLRELAIELLTQQSLKHNSQILLMLLLTPRVE